MYSSLATFVQHKKQKCELKTVCKCQNQSVVENSLADKGELTISLSGIIWSRVCNYKYLRHIMQDDICPMEWYKSNGSLWNVW